jgi:DNA-directed RNA polymerase specialized sigma24 family protein
VKEEMVLTKEAFDRLLGWLDPDRELAARKYEDIRLRLTNIFARRGALDPEDLADQTINRVAHKLLRIQDTYQGDPAVYFYNVGLNLYHQSLRSLRSRLELPPSAPPVHNETRHACLDQCIGQLDPVTRDLALAYYSEAGRSMIEARRELAERHGVTLAALRFRMHRIRGQLERCIDECLRKGESG